MGDRRSDGRPWLTKLAEIAAILAFLWSIVTYFGWDKAVASWDIRRWSADLMVGFISTLVPRDLPNVWPWGLVVVVVPTALISLIAGYRMFQRGERAPLGAAVAGVAAFSAFFVWGPPVFAADLVDDSLAKILISEY